jgi:hypothetical protein
MAAVILAYLLKSNAVLLLFAVAYYGLLRRLTFFGLNRVYLLLALLFAAVYPALPVPALLPAQALPLLPAALAQPSGAAPAGVVAAAAFNWPVLVLGLYAAGTGLLLLRLLAQLVSLAQLRQRSRASWVLGQPVRVLPVAGGPFSFGRTIYLSEAVLADAASLPAALRHEQAHVRQYHTLDVLLTQLATALAWANPAAWLLRRAVLDNLEYLADRAALHSGLDRRAYQYSLLRQQPGGVPAPALAFHFSFLTLKNRIMMLNQPASTARQLGRYLLAAPLAMLLALGYSGAHAQVVPTPAPAKKTLANDGVYYVDGKLSSKEGLAQLDPNSIRSIDVLKNPSQRQALGLNSTSSDGVILITTKGNENSAEVQAFNNRIHRVVPLVVPTPAQESAVTAIKAYMAKNYPTAKLEMVGPASGQADRYQSIFEQGGKRLQLFFDGQGQPVKQ